ncbi:hypothetical protein [Bacillus sp. FJAT-47783]|uniref:hypothetical protein n=1 Tax=Bacillus sp. FJAT-47783 TaxID=2922712 RepID=UPI001FAD2492|nr:hypothetical protein [Bacillus sp. FJAT-47783]
MNDNWDRCKNGLFRAKKGYEMQKGKIKCNYFVIRAIKYKLRAIVTRSDAIISKTRAIIIFLYGEKLIMKEKYKFFEFVTLSIGQHNGFYQ